jgi:hypothetical protein
MMLNVYKPYGACSTVSGVSIVSVIDQNSVENGISGITYTCSNSVSDSLLVELIVACKSGRNDDEVGSFFQGGPRLTFRWDTEVRVMSDSLSQTTSRNT